MTDTIFRQASEQPAQAEEQPEPSNEPTTQIDVEVDPAFTLYKSAKNRSFIADYLGLQDDFNQEAYTEELDEIEGYFKGKVEDGSMENTTDAVKDLLKRYEGEAKTDKSERMVVRIQKLLAYMKFRKAVDDIEKSNIKYGRTE